MDLANCTYVKDFFPEGTANPDGSPGARMVMRLDIPGEPGSDVWQKAFLEAQGVLDVYARSHPGKANVRFINMGGMTIAP